MALILEGTVVTFDEEANVLAPGAVYVADGVLHAVADASAPAPAGFASAPRIRTGGLIYPGLIDLHSHIAYNTLPLWEAADVPYKHHDSWPGEDKPPDYATSVSWPAKVLQQAAAEALIKYVEVKALVGGTTTIQGAPRTTRSVDGWLVRVIENETFGTRRDPIHASALQKPLEGLRKEAKFLSQGNVLIYHVAEGQRGSLVHREFGELETTSCLQPGLIGVHATALTDEDFALWQREVAKVSHDARAAIAWSPFSNLWLYHETTNVAEAAARELRIALGSDWAPSGTKHVLGELKVADLVNQAQFGSAFSDQALCEMVTANPGDALAVAWGQRLGRLRGGAEADVIVVAGRHADPYRNLIEATERDVELVIIRGAPFYGTPALMRSAGAQRPNRLTVAGEPRAVAVRQPGKRDATLTWPQVLRQLEAVRADPVGAWHGSLDAQAAWGGPLDDPDAPLSILGDMPEGDLGLLGAAAEIPADLEIPRLDTLEHDDDFFAAVGRSQAPHLDGLAAYYQ